MNEPHRGYIELYSMYSFDSNTDLQLGYHANALESFALSDGYSLSIPYYVPSFPEPTRISRYEIVNQAKERAWADGKPCIWREHGVWDWDEKSQRPVPLRESYFHSNPRTGEPFEWYHDCWFPFLKKFQERVAGDSERRRSWMTFAAGIPNEVQVSLMSFMNCCSCVISSILRRGRGSCSHTILCPLHTGMTYIPCSQRLDFLPIIQPITVCSKLTVFAVVWEHYLQRAESFSSMRLHMLLNVHVADSQCRVFFRYHASIWVEKVSGTSRRICDGIGKQYLTKPAEQLFVSNSKYSSSLEQKYRAAMHYWRNWRAIRSEQEESICDERLPVAGEADGCAMYRFREEFGKLRVSLLDFGQAYRGRSSNAAPT